LKDIINKNSGKDTFFCPEDNETAVELKTNVEDYPKNFALLKMVEKYMKRVAAEEKKDDIIPNQQPINSEPHRDSNKSQPMVKNENVAAAKVDFKDDSRMLRSMTVA